MIDEKSNEEQKESKEVISNAEETKRIVSDSEVKGFREAFEFIKRMDRSSKRSRKVNILVGEVVDSKENNEF